MPRFAKIEEADAPAESGFAAVAEAPAESPSLTDLAAIIRGAVQDATADLRAEVDALKRTAQAAPPQFRPIPKLPQPEGRSLNLKGMKPGEELQGGRQLPVNARGLSLSETEQRMFPCKFVQGQTVRINREATRQGHEHVEKSWIQGIDERTGVPKAIRQEERRPTNWGEVLDAIKPSPFTRCKGTTAGNRVCGQSVPIGDVCEACGTGPVIRKVERLTKYSGWKYKLVVPGMVGNNRLGDGFAEHEIEAVS